MPTFGRKSDVHLAKRADEWGHFGHIQIRDGKTPFRKRALPITLRTKEILSKWMAKSKSDVVFTREDNISPLSAFTLIQQQERMRNLLNLPWDAVVHGGRHTALTNLGMAGADPFSLQKIAGHANIATTMRYVHPTPPAMKDAFKKKADREKQERKKSSRKKAANVVLMTKAAAAD